MDLKGFFRFLRIDYNTLEFNCLQNKNGRFVELLEYHGGAQRGGIRVPEGYQSAGWDRFATELESFFLGKLALVGDRVGSSRNVRKNPDLAMRDSRDFTTLPTSVIGASNPFKSTSSLNSRGPRVQLDPSAPRPTQKFYFNWDPFPNTLCITKVVGEKR